MIRVTSYTQGKWNSKGTESDLISAVSGETIGQMLQPDLDYAAVCSYAREVGGPKIRELTIHERAFKIKFLAQYLLERGYEVIVSEWHPIEAYGQTHKWNRYTRFPSDLETPKAWGNLVAMRPGEAATAVLAELQKIGKIL
jgi:hypothetical protein